MLLFVWSILYTVHCMRLLHTLIVLFSKVHAFIRGWLAKNVGADIAVKTRIVYGGKPLSHLC